MRLSYKIILLIQIALTVQILLPQSAEARAGRGRSIGRSSSFQRSTPPPYSSYRGNNMNNNNANTYQPRQPSTAGSLLRSVGGGMLGGFLGSALYSSFANSSVPSVGNGLSSNGQGRGGWGFLEIILMAGLAYLAFRWWKGRQVATSPHYEDTNMRRSYSEDTSAAALPSSEPFSNQHFSVLAAQGISTDEAADIFFKVQGAWTRRNLDLVTPLLNSEIRQILNQDLEDLKRDRRINRLENITIRTVHVVNSWEEAEGEFSTVKFTANLLDYTTDEQSGIIIEGSDSVPVKFEEDWTFFKQRNSTWKLAGIEVKA